VNTTTSQCPYAGSTGTRSVPASEGAGGCGESDGKRFSNTATSKCSRGISVSGPPGRVGHSGHAAAAGLYVRSWRSVVTVTHSSWVGS
jgi:hypothetical protein